MRNLARGNMKIPSLMTLIFSILHLNTVSHAIHGSACVGLLAIHSGSRHRCGGQDSGRSGMIHDDQERCPERE
ncbi:hypothetical protein B0I35DRAFT_437868 [Stachybotrys elegans]|uniref:Secreted protein n=1 Tax=Stachybotrys elegans TaxID=80388 RepID=A0A8K0WMY0_9HYPO|nr:hypothetical protein B0I35DRAFT_437868 [Stachybotrys elegans]